MYVFLLGTSQGREGLSGLPRRQIGLLYNRRLAMKELSLTIGAHIHFRDGRGGTLHKIVVDPHTKKITDLVIARGFLQVRDYVIPVSTVEEATTEEIYVSLSTEELKEYPEYREVEFSVALDDWESDSVAPKEQVLIWYPQLGIYERERTHVPAIRRMVPSGIPSPEEAIGRAAVVRNLDGVVGHVDHVWLHPENWEITHLVVHRAILPGVFVIPFSWVQSISPKEIFIRGTTHQLKELSTTQMRLSAIDQPEGVGTAQPIDNSLTVADEVIRSLAADSRTADYMIDVLFDQGVVTLLGRVEETPARAAAEEIAHQNENVISVINALEVRPKEEIVEVVLPNLPGQNHM
jgi:sporulation protein YlmC with PRC-barrel domain